MGFLVADFFDNRLIHFHDSEDKPSFESTTIADAEVQNKLGYSVCFFPNLVVGGRHNKDCQKIRCWFVDVDFKNGKPPLEDLLELSPLLPTYVVESSTKGFHLYFLAKVASFESYRPIQESLINFFDGDPKCKNEARLMRRPGFYHMKDPANPFLTSVVFQSKASYSENQMFLNFPSYEEEVEESLPPESVGVSSSDDNTFDKIRHYNTRIILHQLSGTAYVNFKKYSFKSKGSHYNIYVDGKDSGCFVNEKGNVIGSKEYSGGAVEWLGFYGLNRLEAMRAVKDVMGWV